MTAGPLYAVVEVVDGEEKLTSTTGPYRGKETWNDKPRIYRSIGQARAYKERLRAKGGVGRILEYRAIGEVQ